MSKSIQDLKSDYVLSVSVGGKGKDSGSDVNARDELEPLVRALDEKGFFTEVRAGAPGGKEFLIFVKLSAKRYKEELDRELVRNYEYGITSKNDTRADEQRIIANVLVGGTKDGGLEITPGVGKWEVVKSITPISDSFRDPDLVQDLKYYLTSPDTSTSYMVETYGVRVALYFEYLKFYTLWLVLLATFGVVSFFKSKKRFLLTYTFVNLIWGILFITFWNRKQKYLINYWGVQNSHLAIEWEADKELVAESNSSSDLKIRGNTSGVRFIKQLAFLPIALSFTAVLVSYQLACFVIEIFLAEIYDGPGKIFLTLVPTVLISVFVPILTIVFNLVSDKVIAWESHTNDYTRQNSILIKQFVLNFLTSYGPLLITSFIYLPFAHLIQPHIGDIQDRVSNLVSQDRFYHKYLTQLKRLQDFQMNEDRLNVQFFYFIVTNQVIQAVMKYVLPLILNKGVGFIQEKQSKSEATEVRDDENEKAWLNLVRNTVKLPEYNVNDDYRGLIVQYGYLILFGPVFTLAPLISILFNILTYKMDTLKLSSTKYFKPPIPARVDSIFPWNHALFILTWMGSLISPIITAFYRHGTKPPKTLGQFSLEKASVNTSSSKIVILILLSEHLFFVTWFILLKVSDLFKSDVEWDNDIVSNDLKLRRDYYAKVVKLLKVSDNSSWKNSNAENTLKSVSSIDASQAAISESAQSGSLKKLGPKSNNQQLKKGGDSSGNNVLASAAASVGAVASKVTGGSNDNSGSKKSHKELLEEKKRVLKEKEELLKKQKAERLSDKEALSAVKDKSDSVIESKNSVGQNVYSTIDDNEHFDPSELENDTEKVNEASEANVKDASTKEEISSEADTSQFTDGDTTFASANKSDFTRNAQKTARDITTKVDDTVTNGAVAKKKSSIKKFLAKKK